MGQYGFFDFSDENTNFNIIFIVGPCRSGKSSLGRLLGSLPDYFHIEEDWLLLMSPVMYDKGVLNKEVLINTYRAWINELVYNTVLMRGVSFRPSDHSYICNMKSQKDIDFSLNELKSRSDVDAYMKDHKVTLVFNLAEINPYMHLLEEIYPQASVIHSIRGPLEIAFEVYNKKWFSDNQLIKPANRQIFLKHSRQGKDFYVPFWVDKENAEDFIKMDEKQRAAEYAARQYYLSALSVKKMRDASRVRFVDYNDLIKDPENTIEKIVPEYISSEKTKQLCDELRSRAQTPLLDTDLNISEKDIEFIDAHIKGFAEKYFKIKADSLQKT